MDLANLTKWIFASVASHFSSLENLIIATQDRKNINKSYWYELKIDGPYFSDLYGNYATIVIEVDLQIFSMKDKYLYKNLELQGKGLELFTDKIDIFKLGGKGGDDREFLFCMSLHKERKHGLDVFNLGTVGPNKNLIMSDIEGHYSARIKRN